MTTHQQKLLNLLIIFDKFCREHNYPYYMLGGTMLGAYRHKGFIPWDDDMDIGMPREFFNKFIKEFNNYNKKDIAILRYRTLEKNIPYTFAHLEDTTTTYIERRRNSENYSGGVYIEIFPLDGTSNLKFLQKLQNIIVRIEKKMLYATIMDYNEKHRSIFKKIVIKYIRKHYKIDYLTKKIDNTIKKYKFPTKNNEYVSNYLGHWGIKENIPLKVFNPPIYYTFEGYKFLGVHNAKTYLTSLYGKNFMIPPSKEEQEELKHPPLFVDFDLPYKYYKK